MPQLSQEVVERDAEVEGPARMEMPPREFLGFSLHISKIK
jgi:hypothetical protein